MDCDLFATVDFKIECCVVYLIQDTTVHNTFTNLNKLFPEFKLPANYNTILNVHFKLSKKDIYLFDKKIIGFINTKSHWMFVKNKYISITISDANKFNSMDSLEIADLIWLEVCKYVKKDMKYL